MAIKKIPVPIVSRRTSLGSARSLFPVHRIGANSGKHEQTTKGRLKTAAGSAIIKAVFVDYSVRRDRNG